MTHYFELCFALSLLLQTSTSISELCPKTILNPSEGSIEASGDNLCKIWIIQPPENRIVTLRLNRFIVNNCNDVFFEIRTSERSYNTCTKTRKPKLLPSFKKTPIHITIFSDKKASLALEFSTRPSTICPRHDFQCSDNSSCFDYHQICDGRFNCQDHSDEICDYCPKNQAACSTNGSECFDPKTGRCDGRYDCPSGEDEFNCTTNCIGAISCQNPTECFQPQQRCDGVNDCSGGFDEVNCTSVSCDQHLNFLCGDGKCIREELVGDGNDDCEDGSDEMNNKHKAIQFILLLALIILFCASIVLVQKWCKTRRNINHLIRNPPEFPLPPFRGPGEYAGYELQFSDCDYRHGGEIYEGFVQGRRDGRHGRGRMHRRRMNNYIHNVTPRSSVTNLNDSTLAALASLGIPPEFCVGLEHTKDERESRGSTEETDSLRFITSNLRRSVTAGVNGEEEAV